MVTFNDDSFTIKVSTGSYPVEEWLGLHKELSDILSCLSLDNMPEIRRTVALLAEMMPEWEAAIKMQPVAE